MLTMDCGVVCEHVGRPDAHHGLWGSLCTGSRPNASHGQHSRSLLEGTLCKISIFCGEVNGTTESLKIILNGKISFSCSVG